MRRAELARRLGITYQQVQKYETSVNRVAASTLVEIARILDVKIEYFFDTHEGALTPFRLAEQCHHTLELIMLFARLSRSEQAAFLELMRSMMPALPKPDKMEDAA